MTIFELFLIALIVCYVVDISGIVTSIKEAIAKRLSKKLKVTIRPEDVNISPFDCSRCANWWTLLLFIIISGNFSLINLALVAFFSLISSNLSGFLQLFVDILSVIEHNIVKKLYKNG